MGHLILYPTKIIFDNMKLEKQEFSRLKFNEYKAFKISKI